jgi:hypothetical protein
MRATFTELTEGKPFLPMAGRKGPDLTAAGYVRSEWTMSGEAVSYDAAAVPEDGRVELTEADSAAYATRVLVRRPEPEAFSGVLLIEWLNVSGGQDAAPEYTYVVDEILRRGHAWVGVSAQYIGVEGGDAAVGLGGLTVGLRRHTPERYGDLHHPGDAYSYDIVTQLAEYARDPEPGGPLGDLRPTTVLAVGESQSAFALTSYLDGVHPLTRAFDGYFLHSRGAGYLPYDDRGHGSDISASLFNGPVRLREDQGVPVMLVQAEGDLTFPMGFAPARQPDSEHVMTWEIAGSAHADVFQLGEFAPFVDCDGPINNGQQAFVLRAALRHLERWVADGTRPPSAPPIEMADDEVIIDDWGHARGGVRTPAVDAPVERLVGAPLPDAQPICMLLGRTIEVSPAVLEARWTDRAQYLHAYREATDRLIGEGFLLEEDRDEVLEDARVGRVSW